MKYIKKIFALTMLGFVLFTGCTSQTLAPDNALARFDTTTGKLIQNSLAILADNGELALNDSTTSADATPLSLIANTGASHANILLLNNSTGAGNFKSEIRWYSGATFKWALGNDSGANGTTDFGLYDSVNSDYRFTIADNFTLKPRGANAVIALSDSTTPWAATGAVTPMIVRSSNPSIQPNCLALDNGHGAGNFKNQIALLAGGVFKWAFGNDSAGNGTDDFWIYQDSLGDFAMKIKTGGNMEIVGSIQTGNPSGGTAAQSKIGSVTSISVPTLALNYLQFESNGVAYKIALLT